MAQYYEVVEGDYNDVFSRKYVKVHDQQQIDSYVKEYFGDMQGVEDLNSDSIGYAKYFIADTEELLIEYYVEAIEIEDTKEIAELEEQIQKSKTEPYNEMFYWHHMVDLTEE